jgi:hypothetical protein
MGSPDRAGIRGAPVLSALWRILLWACLVAGLLLAMATILSYPLWRVRGSVSDKGAPQTPYGHFVWREFELSVEDGRLHAGRWEHLPGREEIGKTQRWGPFAVWQTARGPGQDVVVSGPAWLVVALLVPAPAYFLFAPAVRRRARRRRGRCLNCGYDLRGDTAGRCPECGARVPA